MYNVTREDVLTGHNFPETKFWQGVHKEFLNKFMNQDFGKREAVHAANAVLDTMVEEINKDLNDSSLDQNPFNVEVKSWISKNKKSK